MKRRDRMGKLLGGTTPPTAKAGPWPPDQIITTTLWTDGCCLRNPGGPGGWAFLITQRMGGVEFNRLDGSGHLPVTTNQRAELIAILEGLKSLPAKREYERYSIVSDSKYALNVLSGTWHAEANLDLIKACLPYIRDRGILTSGFTWVKGHNRNPENEHCDVLAGKAARQRRARYPTDEYGRTLMDEPRTYGDLD